MPGRNNQVTDVVIRPVRAEDLPELVAVESSASSRYQEEGFSLDEAPPRDEQDLHRLADETTMLVAQLDGAIVGYCSFFLIGPYLHLEELAVARDLQGRGIGRRLAEAHLEAAISMSERSHYSLIAFRDAVWATGLYSRLGFVPLGSVADSMPDVALLDRLVVEDAAVGLDPPRRQVMVRRKSSPSLQ